VPEAVTLGWSHAFRVLEQMESFDAPVYQTLRRHSERREESPGEAGSVPCVYYFQRTRSTVMLERMPMPSIRRIAIVAGSYLLGGVSTGYYLVRLVTGDDVRRSGSGSSGARNVGRSLGRWGFIVTAAGDIGKGAAIPVLARRAGAREPDIALASVAAVAGHVWPVQLGFRGGRGLTVAFGALLATELRTAGAAVLLAGGLFPVVRNLTGASLLATAAAPLIARMRGGSPPVARGIAGMAAIVLVGHRHSIRRAFVNTRQYPDSGDAT